MQIDAFDARSCDPHAIVREEDTQLLLTAAVRPVMPGASLRQLEAEALRARGRPPGSVVVRPGRPLLLLAVIHDVECEPSWQEDWIARATDAALRAAHWRGLTRVAMPLLGTVHGRLPQARAIELLGDAIERAGDAGPRTLWLEAADAGPVELLRRRFAQSD